MTLLEESLSCIDLQVVGLLNVNFSVFLVFELLNVLFPVTAPDIAVEVKAAPSKPYDKDTLFASLYVI